MGCSLAGSVTLAVRSSGSFVELQNLQFTVGRGFFCNFVPAQSGNVQNVRFGLTATVQVNGNANRKLSLAAK